MSDTQDSHQGGDLNQMAKDGTKVPGDAGKMNTVPSVASQDQKTDREFGASQLNTAADNPAGAGSADDEAITATGHSIDTSAFTKHSGHGGKEANH
ncbi:hypothetical protein F5Y18DRAFT_410694 [Xylariaceae sp. FL1019]|nr:hypothetical protein F5Y18DRAFT_410694 [Xylariaceae sp. FL1019]